ncbi:MAG TPA: family 20 glycosylhydrolase, partial [Balneolaceae bacterium]|nr:family 20 glycosylhydrolase [Balneolaceae bacterium]
LRDISISDYPTMKFRGVSDDMSRGQVSTEKNIKKIIRFMARYKMNAYLPYIEDIIHFKDYPKIGKNRGRFTKKEVAELQNYAEKYHVKFIPYFETLGHQENMLNMKPFRKYAEYPGSNTFDTQSDSSLNFVKKLTGEILPWFDSKYFDIGGDESFDVGRGASKAAVNHLGIATVTANYYRKIYDFVKSHGKKVIMSSNMMLHYPKMLAQLPDSLIIADWHYGARAAFPSTKVYNRINQPFIVQPGISNWRRLYPNQSAAWVNTYNFVMDGYKNGAIGSITSSWGDMGGPNFRELNYRGYAYNAECAWNPSGADESTIDTRFDRLFFGSSSPRLAGIENLLNRLSEDLDFSQVWEQPFDRLKDFKHASHVSLLNETTDIKRISNTIQRMDSTLKPELKRNHQELDYYNYAAKLAGWTANSIKYAHWMKRIANNHITSESRQPYQEKAINWGNRLKNKAAKLQSEFDALWLRTNRKANLNLIDTLFNYQKFYLGDITNSLSKNIWDSSYKISSKFIAAYGASKSNAIRKTYLRKSFHLNSHKKIKHAYLQLVANSYATLYVNNHKVGETVAKVQGSLGIDLNLSHYWDVTHLLNSHSKNVIAARVENYHLPPKEKKAVSWLSGKSPASVNIFLKIEYADGSTQTIRSNSYWKTNTNDKQGWKSIKYDDEDWLPAAVVKDPMTVYKPQFDHGLPSFVKF